MIAQDARVVEQPVVVFRSLSPPFSRNANGVRVFGAGSRAAHWVCG
jgi:hypothetical protein